MAKNTVQFQKCYCVFALLKDYGNGTEEKCSEALFSWRYPQGFVSREYRYKLYYELGGWS